MSCKEMKKYLSGYLDGELVTSQREKVGRHLSKCADCRKEMESLKGGVSAVSALGSSLSTIEPSPEILSQIRGRISQVPTTPIPLPVSPKGLIVGIVIGATVISGLLYFYRAEKAEEKVIRLEEVEIDQELLRLVIPTIGEDSALGNFIIQSIIGSKADSLSTGQETSLELLAQGLKLLDVKELREISVEHPEYAGTGERRPPASGVYQEAAKLFIDASRITSTGASDATVEAIKALEKGTLSYHVGGKIEK